ncbi:hypothetical protein KEC55_09170 [Burkholderia cepacia]|uniref:hypothetical protein n=1 Tax=Burkholderia cepacia TaxID=292 RepID=UPI00249F8D4B|nr:hypothetical protein [Burkholderia cepacia]WGY67037.1 hypothetical protein KEC55_09170 [Burkholderia cepacia]
MGNANPQSLWTHDLLWSKARAYVDKAFEAPREDDLFPFWASLALEFLARSALAFVHPALLADASEPDGRNLLYAFGFEPKVKNYVPKSIQTSEVLLRCEQIIPDFTKELESFCKGLANKRNEELHSGGLPFSKLANHTWLPRFFEATQVLLRFQKKTLRDFLGKDEADAAVKMLAAAADETAKSVKGLINAHAEVWKNKAQDERDELAKTAASVARPNLGHVIDCPSCNSKALLLGEGFRQQPPVLEHDEMVVRTLMLPTELICKACGLTIKGHNQLFAAGFGSQFTKTLTFDPVDYYAEEPDDEDRYNEFNNE